MFGKLNDKYWLIPTVTTTEREALTATNGMLVYDTTLSKFYSYQNGAWIQTISSGGSAAWGDITGTLSEQTDLQDALDTKASATDLNNHTSNTNNPHSVTATQADALKRDGSNANSDITLDGYSINAKSFHTKGTGGTGHVGLKHQASDATAGGGETSIFAGSDGELYYKNDGNAVAQIASRTWVSAQGFITNIVTALGYTPENTANKTDTISGNTTSSTKYLSAKGVYDWVISLGYITSSALSGYLTSATAAATYQVILTASNFGSFLTGLTGKTTPVDADEIGIVDSAASNVAKKLTWANLKATLKNYFDTLYAPKHFLINTTQTTVQGTATELKACSIEIPANWFAVGSGMSVSSFASKSAQTANDSWQHAIYLNSSDSLSGAVFLGYFQPSNLQRWNGLERSGFVFTSNTNLQSISTASVNTDVSALSSTLTNYTVPNITSTMYLIIGLKHIGSSQADTLTHLKTVVYRET